MKTTITILFLILSFQAFSQSDSEKKLSQAEIKSFILAETKEGGKLDFFTEISGKEYNASQVKPGLFMTNIEVALYKWGKANFELGVKNAKTALKIFEEFKGRDLNSREKDLIPMGYRNELSR
ncbi:MAG: hypothetical protein QM710_13865 [Flavobacterium sp.]